MGVVENMDISRSALSLVIHKDGNVCAGDIDYVIDFYRVKKGITLDKDKYREAVEVSSVRYKNLAKGLFICTDKPCLRKSFINPSDKSLELLSKEIDCPIEITGCHWQCEQAPVATLKIGTISKSFLRCSSSDSWKSIRQFVFQLTKSLEGSAR